MAKIVVAEDSVTSAVLISQILTAHGHEVLLAHDGDEAKDTIHRQHPDLVVADIIMPKLSGLELCRALRAEKQFETLPIILVSVMDRAADRYWGLKQGANDYLAKPIDPQGLIRKVNALLKERDVAKNAISKTGTTISSSTMNE